MKETFLLLLTPFLIALGSAISVFLWGVRKGSIAYVCSLIVITMLACWISVEALMIISYSLLFGFPILAGAILLGIAAGLNFRQRNFGLSALFLSSPLILLLLPK